MIFLTRGTRTLKDKISIWAVFLVSTLVGIVFYPFFLLKDALNPPEEDTVYFDEDEEDEEDEEE